MDISGKAAIVTGSAVGVGRATALELARRGARVVINYSRSEEEARQTLAEVESLGTEALLVRADVSRDDQVRAMVRQTLDRFGSVDVLVNNAAITYFVNFADLDALTEEMWDRILAVNVKGVFFCSRAVAGPMREGGGGCIVNISSVAGIRGAGSSIAYTASKAAVINLTMAFARTLAPEVRVNCVAPGFIDTRWHWGRKSPEEYEQAKERVARETPLRRVCTAEDVAQAVLSLIQGADLVTGQTLVVDGGSTLRF
ncbi:MAG: glucose 1-dehydrogenase [Candidatus Bathyarchaeota archaeon]|nr:glucose 1-dehydrogenase [Candidatus Bathyarchaeota archaeon]